MKQQDKFDIKTNSNFSMYNSIKGPQTGSIQTDQQLENFRLNKYNKSQANTFFTQITEFQSKNKQPQTELSSYTGMIASSMKMPFFGLKKKDNEYNGDSNARQMEKSFFMDTAKS